ncbi:MAG: hypothetical protein WCP21_20730 [Armatimonadota bacterium]
MTYSFDKDGTYTGTDGADPNPYTESGTWEVSGWHIVISMLTNNAGRPAEDLTAGFELVDSTDLVLTYDADLGNGHFISVVETYTRQ